MDPSIYNPILENPRKPIDPPVPLQYACTCIQISLDTLDALSDPTLVPGSAAFFQFAASQPPPFRLLCVLRSATELGAVDLAVIEGVPTVAVAKNHETVVFKELTGVGMLSTLCCAREEPYSSNVSHPVQILKSLAVLIEYPLSIIVYVTCASCPTRAKSLFFALSNSQQFPASTINRVHHPCLRTLSRLPCSTFQISATTKWRARLHIRP